MSSQQDRRVPPRELRRPWAVVINDVGIVRECVRALYAQFPDRAAVCLPELSGDEVEGGVVVLVASPESGLSVAAVRSGRHSEEAPIQSIDPKPIREAIQQAMTVPRFELAGRGLTAKVPVPFRYHRHLFDASGRPGGFLAIESIVCVRAAGQGTHVYTANGRSIKSATRLKDWEARLPDTHFARIHRSTIVNMDRVERTEREPNHSGQRMFLQGMREPLMLSRRYAARFRQRRI